MSVFNAGRHVGRAKRPLLSARLDLSKPNAPERCGLTKMPNLTHLGPAEHAQPRLEACNTWCRRRRLGQPQPYLSVGSVNHFPAVCQDKRIPKIGWLAWVVCWMWERRAVPRVCVLACRWCLVFIARRRRCSLHDITIVSLFMKGLFSRDFPIIPFLAAVQPGFRNVSGP